MAVAATTSFKDVLAACGVFYRPVAEAVRGAGDVGGLAVLPTNSERGGDPWRGTREGVEARVRVHRGRVDLNEGCFLGGL